MLLFAEHLAFLSGERLAEAVERLRRAAPEKKLAIEVTALEDAKAAAEAGFDIIQAERLSASLLAEFVAGIAPAKPRPLIAAAGGITADLRKKPALTFLVTSATYLAPPRDVRVRFTTAASRSVFHAGVDVRNV